jgi:son of sevenless-like protein
MRKLIDVLEREDLHILDRVKDFCNEVAATDPTIAGVAKTVLSIITRVVSL